ncbi:MAG: hypothetical protein ACLGI9_05610, partial [Thermoanaerobaculia bacterium]
SYLADQAYANALHEVRAVLLLDPTNPRGLELLEKTQQGLLRNPGLYPPAAPRETKPRTPEVASATPQEPASEPVGTPAEAEKATLSVNIDVDPKAVGTLIVWLDKERVFSRDFKSRGWTVLRNRRQEQDQRSFRQDIKLLPDTYTLKAHFTPKNRSAKIEERNSGFRGGDHRTFHVKVSESGEVTVSLE